MPSGAPSHTVSIRSNSVDSQRGRHAVTDPAHSGHMNYSGVPRLRGVTCRPADCCRNAGSCGVSERTPRAYDLVFGRRTVSRGKSAPDLPTPEERAAVYLPITTRQLADGT